MEIERKGKSKSKNKSRHRNQGLKGALRVTV
jgi:hypothetical protein